MCISKSLFLDSSYNFRQLSLIIAISLSFLSYLSINIVYVINVTRIFRHFAARQWNFHRWRHIGPICETSVTAALQLKSEPATYATIQSVYNGGAGNMDRRG